MLSSAGRLRVQFSRACGHRLSNAHPAVGAAGPRDGRGEAMALRAAHAGDNLLRSGATVGLFTAAGRICGFAREIAVAAVLGAGPAADAFFLALRVPGFIRKLFAGRGVGAVFIPMFTRRLARAGASPARVFAGEVVWFAAVAVTALTVLLELAAPWLVHLLAPGFAGEEGQAELTATLVRIMLPCVLFASLAQLLGGMLNGLGKFAAASAMPVVFNLAVLAVLLGFATRLSAPTHVLAWGIAAAGAAQLGFVGVCCQRAGMLPGPVRPTRRVRRLLRRSAPAVVGVGASQAVLLVDLALATLLAAGSVSYVHYAGRVARLLPSVAGAAAATVLLPYLARRGAREGAAKTGATNRTLEAVLLLGVPGAVALAVIAEPVVAGLLQRGAFGAHAVVGAAATLTAYAGGMDASEQPRGGVLRARRHGDAHGGRARRGPGQSGSEPCPDGAARPCGDRARHQRCCVDAVGFSHGLARAPGRLGPRPAPVCEGGRVRGGLGAHGGRVVADAAGARGLSGRRRVGADRGARGAGRGGTGLLRGGGPCHGRGALARVRAARGGGEVAWGSGRRQETHGLRRLHGRGGAP